MSRVNEIFAVNRLRQSWSQKDEAAGLKEKKDGALASPDLKNVMEVFERLVFIAKNRYSDAQMIPLELLFESLKEKLNIKFTGVDSSISEDMLELTPVEPVISEPEISESEIIELLSTIEDIAEGFDCLR